MEVGNWRVIGFASLGFYFASLVMPAVNLPADAPIWLFHGPASGLVTLWGSGLITFLELQSQEQLSHLEFVCPMAAAANLLYFGAYGLLLCSLSPRARDDIALAGTLAAILATFLGLGALGLLVGDHFPQIPLRIGAFTWLASLVMLAVGSRGRSASQRRGFPALANGASEVG